MLLKTPGTPAWLAARGRAGGIWTPEGMSGLVNWLPLAEGAGAADQLIPDLVSGAGATYRGDTAAVEATDPTWTAEGLSFDGGDYCNMSAGGFVTDGSGWTVMILANPTVNTGTLYCEGNAGDTKRVYLYLTAPGNLWIRVKNVVDTYNNVSYVGAGWRTLSAVVTGWTSVQLGVNGVAVGAPGAITSMAGVTPTFRYIGCQAYQATRADFISDPVGYFLAFNRALNTAEIAASHNYIRGRVAGRGITLPAA